MVSAEMTLRLLGPVRVSAGGREARVSGAKARAVLAALALRVGRVVSVDQLVEDLWGDRAPATARNTAQVYVSAVRRGLEAFGGAVQVNSQPGGYRLVAGREQVDWYLFEALVAQGRLCGRQGDHQMSGRLLGEALALWEGPALADTGETPLGEAFTPSMEAARLAALTDRIEADLATGSRGNLVAELTELTARHPLDERLAGQLMLALYYAGRRGEALALYGTTRRRLVEDLGVEPGSRLRQVHQQILSEHPILEPEPVSAARPANLRDAADFVGRASEIAQVVSLLADHRLVTVAGPPGVGKSRTAAEIIRVCAGDYADGVWFVRLDGVTDEPGVVQAVADALGIDAGSHRPRLDRLRAYLLGRSALLVLDNCEHVRRQCAEFVTALLAERPRFRILITSTQPLRAAGEALLRLDPLTVPALETVSAHEIAHIDAVRLFCLRARAVQPRFELTDQNALSIAAICRAVDGLPLAIELASGRTSVLSGPELLSRLADQLDILTTRGRSDDSRHSSLRSALQASWAVLSPQESRLLTRLSVFAGGFTLDAAESVGAAESGSCLPVLDVLHDLVDKSLVAADVSGDETWFRMLDSIRQFARALDAAQVESARAALAGYLVAMTRTAASERRGARRAYWLRRLNAERASIGAALDWALEHDQVETALDLASALWWWWANDPREGLRRYRQVLGPGDAPSRPGTPGQLLPALLSAAVTASYTHLREAMGYAQQALEAARAQADAPSTMRALQHISDIAYEQGDLGRAVETGDEALQVATELHDAFAVGRCRLTVAYNHMAEVRLEVAQSWAVRAQESFRAAGDEGGQADARLVIAETLLLRGEPGEAEPILEQILAVFRRDGAQGQIARASSLLAWVLALDGQRTDCAELVRDAFDIHAQIGHAWSIAHDLDVLAAIHTHQQRFPRATTLLGAASAVRGAAELVPMPRDLVVREEVERRCQAALDPPLYRAAIRKGTLVDLQSAVNLARDVG